MREELSLKVGSRDELGGWILIERDCIFVQIGGDSTVLVLAQSPVLSSILLDDPSAVALHVKIVAQRLCKSAPGKQVFVSTDQIDEESQLFWDAACIQVKARLELLLQKYEANCADGITTAEGQRLETSQ